MLRQSLSIPRLCSFLVVFGALLAAPAWSQQDDQGSRGHDESSVEGSVVSSSRSTFVVRSDDNQFHLYTFDPGTARPAVGSRVRVNSDEDEQAGARHATNVAVLDKAQSGSSSSSSSSTTSTRDAAPIPPAVRNVEGEIQRDARRWRVGVRGGVGLDPELVLFGVHSQMGPIFSRNVFFRPNAEFAWGEISDMVGLNFEAVYRLPASRRINGWAPYLGGGPSMNFIHQSFQSQAGQGRNIDFGNFDYETGLNLLMGMQNRHGTFFELKTSVYSHPAPVLRLIVGHNF